MFITCYLKFASTLRPRLLRPIMFITCYLKFALKESGSGRIVRKDSGSGGRGNNRMGYWFWFR